MTIPNVVITVTDGDLGVISPSNGSLSAKLGTCSLGSPNQVYSFSDPKKLQDTLGVGPLVEAAAHQLAVAGGPVYCVPVTPSVAGTCGPSTVPTGAPLALPSGASAAAATSAVTPGAGNTGLSVMTITGTPIRNLNLVVKMTTGGGAPANGIFVYSEDGGVTYRSGYVTCAASVVLGDTGLTLAFSNATVVAGDTYAAKSVVHAISGTAVLTPSGAAKDDLQVVAQITTAGANLAALTAAFKYSLDNGRSFSSPIAMPVGGVYVIPSTGITLTWADGTFVVGDTWTFTTVAPYYATGDVTTALTALFANAAQWGFVHLVGVPRTPTGARSMASTLDTQMTTAFTAARYIRALMEAPDVSDAELTANTTGFGDFASSRVGVAAGFADLTSSLTGRQTKRPAAWPYAARLGAKTIGQSPARVRSGSLPGVLALYRDENATPALDAARFVTLRTILGKQGIYVTQGKMMAATGSDFGVIQRGQVMDLACTTARGGALTFLEDTLRVDSTTGFLQEGDARSIEQYLTGLVNAAVVAPGHASSAAVTVNRADNLLSDPTLRIKVKIVPLGYASAIEVDLAFTNPALTLAAP